MKMTPVLLIFGSLLVFWASASIAVFLPAVTLDEKPSTQWRAMTDQEKAGLHEYVVNGCSYCHSQFIRNNDWDIGSGRIADKGDYYRELPAILGTERTGPDLSQEGGEHPDDWQLAHFVNPRYTRPMSLMPSWEFLGPDKIARLTAYVQFLGGKNADYRVKGPGGQNDWRAKALAAWKQGPDVNIEWVHAQVPAPWRPMPNPYPATPSDLARGQEIYQQFCINCHGPMGDGGGPAKPYLKPEPLNFTLLKRHLVQNKYIGGILYYQIMNGITGTAMPYFKKELESEKIWDVSNYIAVNFIGYTDAGIEPRGIRASYEPPWTNTSKPPTAQELGQTPATSPATREAPHESK